MKTHLFVADKVLLQSFFNGNSKALGTLFMRYEKDVKNFIYLFTKNETLTEDLWQDTACKAILAIHRFDIEKKFLTWLLKIAQNSFIDNHRSEKRRPTYSTDPATFTQYSEYMMYEDELTDHKELRNYIEIAIKTFPCYERKVMELLLYQDMKFQDISYTLQQPIGTIKMRIRLGKMKLKAFLQREKIFE